MVGDNKDNINIMGSEIIIYRTDDGQTKNWMKSQLFGNSE